MTELKTADLRVYLSCLFSLFWTRVA